jgi:hypothetical protein
LRARSDLVANHLEGTLPDTLGTLQYLTTLCVARAWHFAARCRCAPLPGRGPRPQRCFARAALTRQRHARRLCARRNAQNCPENDIGNCDAQSPELVAAQPLLTGAIPDLSAVRGLVYLGLSGNSLSGPVPAWLGSLGSLFALGLNDNRLSGTLPASLGNATALRYLNVLRNDLSGSLPSTLGALTNMDFFSANDNNLSGSLPAELGACVLLTVLCVRPARSGASVRSRSAHTRRSGGATAAQLTETDTARKEPCVQRAGGQHSRVVHSADAAREPVRARAHSHDAQRARAPRAAPRARHAAPRRPPARRWFADMPRARRRLDTNKLSGTIPKL